MVLSKYYSISRIGVEDRQIVVKVLGCIPKYMYQNTHALFKLLVCTIKAGWATKDHYDSIKYVGYDKLMNSENGKNYTWATSLDFSQSKINKN